MTEGKKPEDNPAQAARKIPGLVLGLCAVLVSPVLAQISDDPITREPITRQDVEDELTRRGSARSGKEAWQHALEDLVERRLRAAAAIEAGYADDPEIRAAIERLLADRLERDQLQPRLAALEISDDEVAAAYAENPERFATAEQVRVALIRLESTPRAGLSDEITDEILQASPEIDPEHGFGDLARRHSTDRASRYVGGVLGWWVRGDSSRWPPEVVAQGFGLRTVGDVGQVEVAGSLYLLRLVERRTAATPPLADVADRIRRHLLMERRSAIRDAFHAELRQRFEVEIDPRAAVAPAPSRPSTPPSLPADHGPTRN